MLHDSCMQIACPAKLTAHCSHLKSHLRWVSCLGVLVSYSWMNPEVKLKWVEYAIGTLRLSSILESIYQIWIIYPIENLIFNFSSSRSLGFSHFWSVRICRTEFVVYEPFTPNANDQFRLGTVMWTTGMSFRMLQKQTALWNLLLCGIWML